MGITQLLRDATAAFLDENKVSSLILSKKLDLRYQVASIILDELELIGIISPYDDGGHVLLISSMDEFEEKAGEYYSSLFPAVKEELKLEDTSSYNSEEEYEEEISYDSEEKKDKTILEVEEIGEHSFQSSVSRGGEVLFPEHIYVNDFEVTWEKKSGVFSKDTKTIPIAEVTQIDIKTTLLSASIVIRSKGYGQIKGEHFAKSDASRIKKLIETVKSQLKR
jgi:hypothetical protein